MRTAAALLVLLGSLLGGAVWQRGQRRRIVCLSGLSRALSRLEAELTGKNASLPARAALLAGEEGAAGAFFSALSEMIPELGERSFRQLWCEAMEGELCALNDEEMRAVRELGAVLGRYPLDMQLASLSRCRKLLDDHLEQARRKLPDDARLVWGLSAACGLFLLIILL